MIAIAGDLASQYVGAGPIERWIRSSIARQIQVGDLSVCVAERSPLGAKVMRIKSSDPAVADWLGRQDWVESVAARPPQLYFTTSMDWLRAVMVEGYRSGDPSRGAEGEGRRLTVTVMDAKRSERPIAYFREKAVAMALAALLQSRGYDRRFEEAGAQPVKGIQVPVSGVDLPHGPMLSRFGGSFGADDLISVVRARVAEPDTAVQGAAFVLLRSERTRKISLDQAKVDAESATFALLWSLHQGNPGAVPTQKNTDQIVRGLTLELEMLASVVARATSELEPAFLARYLKNVAEQTYLSMSSLNQDRDLLLCVTQVISIGLKLLGIYRESGAELAAFAG